MFGQATKNRTDYFLQFSFRMLVIMVSLFFACNSTPEIKHASDQDAFESDPTNAQVAIETSEGRRIVYQVELARSEQERAIGLMQRTSLPDDHGMFFVFPSERIQSFWMKDTYIPLDILFISKDLQIVGIVKDAQPLDTTSLRVPTPSQYVLEINAGQAKKWGLQTGDSVTCENFTP